MLTIIEKSKTVHVEKYQISFVDVNDSGSGYGFECDKNGNLFPFKYPEGQKSYDYCMANPDKMRAEGTLDYSYDYRESAKGKCECGRIIDLEGDSMGECDCECGRVYTIFGQELIGHTMPWAGQNEDGEYYSEDDAY